MMCRVTLTLWATANSIPHYIKSNEFSRNKVDAFHERGQQLAVLIFLQLGQLPGGGWEGELTDSVAEA